MGSLNRAEFDKEINNLLSKAEENIPVEILPDLPFMKSVPDVHEWHDFEHKIWNTGEKIRQLASASQMAFNRDQIDRILNIGLNNRAKRGRQSFVMLLGKVKYREYSDALIPLLQDDDVSGHVIDTLYKMRVNSYVALITPFLNHKQTWIRNTAKKYVQKFENSD